MGWSTMGGVGAEGHSLVHISTRSSRGGDRMKGGTPVSFRGIYAVSLWMSSAQEGPQ